MFGIDVYEGDGKVDWQAVKNSGKTFAFVKATEGVTIKDKLFPSHWAGMKKVGIIRGAYHFFHPRTSAPAQQAQEFLKTLGKLEPGDLPPVLDVEVTDKGASRDVIIKGMKQWLAIVETGLQKQTGKVIKPLIYTYPHFWIDILGDPAGFADYPLWIANFGVKDPTIPPSWGPGNWLVHQYEGDVGGVTGVQGRADLNRFHSIQETSKGTLVKQIQQRLVALKKLDSRGVDGIFGFRTKAAVISFQKATGLQADGIVGLKTWVKLLWS